MFFLSSSLLIPLSLLIFIYISRSSLIFICILSFTASLFKGCFRTDRMVPEVSTVLYPTPSVRPICVLLCSVVLFRDADCSSDKNACFSPRKGGARVKRKKKKTMKMKRKKKKKKGALEPKISRRKNFNPAYIIWPRRNSNE